MDNQKIKVAFYQNVRSEELYTNELKIDLDLKYKLECITQLKDRLSYMQYFNLLDFKLIKKVELIKKKNYSCKITLEKKLNPYVVLLVQAILGDDWKRSTVCARDFLIDDSFNWNRLFNVKYYANGTVKTGRVIDITKQILSKKKKVL